MNIHQHIADLYTNCIEGREGFNETMRNLEKCIILYTLNKNGGSIMQSAKDLGLNRTTLSMKINYLGVRVSPDCPANIQNRMSGEDYRVRAKERIVARG